MTNSTSRALRRHHEIRMRNKLIQKYKDYGYSSEEINHITINRSYNNAAVCSCSMCCNERRNPWLKRRNKLSLQEKKAEDSFKADIYEYTTLSNL